MPINDPTKRLSIHKTMRVYSGSSNRELAQKIADILGSSSPGLRSSSLPTARFTPATKRPSAAPTFF